MAECALTEVLAARGLAERALPIAEACVPGITTYGQIEPWRRQSAIRLRERLRASVE